MPPVVSEDRAVGALVGLVVGDALGVPLEFIDRDQELEVRDMQGGGPFHLKPGQWTDDTSMALCLADSLLANDGLDETDLMKRFVRWWRTGENSVNGRCFDIGNTTREALEAFDRTGVWKVEREDPHSAGNGSLMRLAPAVLFAVPEPADGNGACGPAEPHDPSSCRCPRRLPVFSRALDPSSNWRGERRVDAVTTVDRHGRAVPNCVGQLEGECRQEIASSGYVLHTLEAALWSVHRSNSFEEALICAVNLGDDSDSVGAVTGQLAGALWGLDGIPERWLAKLAWRKQIEQKAVALFRARQ
jgi:ADP-ribosylglycohydrolase